MIDSAMEFLNAAEQFGNLDIPINRMYYYDSRAAIASARGDSIDYWVYSSKEKHISDSLMACSPKPEIIMAESAFDKLNYHSVKRGYSMSKTIIIILLASIAFTDLLIWWRNKKRKNRYNKIIEKLKNESDAQLAALDILHRRCDKLTNNDIRSREFIASQIKMLQKLTIACYREPKNKLADQFKNMIEYQNVNRLQWQRLYGFIDAEYNGIMSDIQRDYPDLNDKEVLLVALSCLDFSYIQIAIILGYPNPTSVGTLKLRVAKKMRLNISLNDYISFKSKH